MSDQRKIKQAGNVVMILLVIATLILAIVSLLIRDKGIAEILRWISFGMMLALLLFRVFSGKVGNKPAREEIEEQVFGQKN